jgi:hypothetical protein
MLDFMSLDSRLSRFLRSPRLYVEALVLKGVLRLKVCWELSLIDVRIPKSTLLGAWGYCGGGFKNTLQTTQPHRV